MAVPTKLHVGVGMAVCRQDILYKDYTSNPIPTSFFLPEIVMVYELSPPPPPKKKDVGMGLLV